MEAARPLGISMLQKSRFFSITELGGHMFMEVTYDLANKDGQHIRVNGTEGYVELLP